TGVRQRTQGFPVEKITRSAGQPAFNSGRRLWHHQLKNLHTGLRGFKLSRFRRHEQHASAFLGWISLLFKMDESFGGSPHEIHQVEITPGLKIELLSFSNGSFIYR